MRSSSRGSGMYAAAMRSRSRSVRAFKNRKSQVRVQSAHTFSRRVLMGDPITVTGTFESKNLTFKFDDLVGYSEFSAMFENYRITKIVVTFQLMNNPNSYHALGTGSALPTANWYPKLWYTVDHDGGSDENISTMKERQGVRCKILQPNKVIRVSFKPMCRTLSYKTATTEGFAPKNIKLDMADVNVPHYGLLYLVDTNGIDPNDTYPFKIAMETQMFFTCSGVR